MLQLNFEYKKDRQIECNMFLYYIYAFLTYPYYTYFRMFGINAVRTWDPYRC
jgi:hypothetical protein